MSNSETIIYEVYILRRDQNIQLVEQTDNYEQAYEKWNSLQDQWSDCLKEGIPFRIEKPLVTAFDPGLIYEIQLRPQQPSQKRVGPHNPYQQEMIKDGFGSAFNKFTGSDVLDGGYK